MRCGKESGRKMYKGQKLKYAGQILRRKNTGSDGKIIKKNKMNIYQQFGILKAGKKLPKEKSKTHGSLIIDNFIMEHDKPFSILNYLRGTKYKHIHKSRIKIVAVIKK